MQATVYKLRVVLFSIIVGWGMNRNVALILYRFVASGSSRRRFKSRSEYSRCVLYFYYFLYVNIICINVGFR